MNCRPNTINGLILLCVTVFTVYIALCNPLPARAKEVQASNRETIITGKVQNYKTGDTIKLFVWKELLSQLRDTYVPHQEFVSINGNGEFYFKFESNSDFSYVSLYNGAEELFGMPLPIFNHYIISTGDSIFIRSSKDTITFSGNGHEKFICQYELSRSIRVSALRKTYPKDSAMQKVQGKYLLGFAAFISTNEDNEEVYKRKREILSSYKHVISEPIYMRIERRLQLESEILMMRGLRMRHSALNEMSKDQSFNKESVATVKYNIWRMNKFYEERFANSDSPFLNAGQPISYEDIKWKIQRAILATEVNQLPNSATFKEILKEKDSVLRDAVITSYIIDYQNLDPNFETNVKKALLTLKNTTYIALIKELYDRNGIGRPAYKFALKDFFGTEHKLNDYIGKVVLLDFWYTGCTACAKYYQEEMSKAEKHYGNNPEVIFITICVDKDFKKFQESVASGSYTGHNKKNVINLTTGTLSVNHPVISYFSVKSYPRPILIDKNGLVFNNSRELRSRESLIKLIGEALNSPSLGDSYARPFNFE